MIELPRWLWRVILHGRVLRTRPKNSARLYASIWQPEGSPILLNSQAIVSALATIWEEQAPGRFVLALGMRYGCPSIPDGLRSLREAGAGRLVALPLFPQYSAVTAGSTFDSVARTLSGWRRVPAFRFIDQYHDDPNYIRALVASIETAWSEAGRPDRLLFSYHGLPQSYCDLGDPYPDQCQETTRLVIEALGLEPSDWAIAFQSRFGRDEWLRPYTEDTLTEWGQEHLDRVDVITPGFAVDCLEMLEEIAVQGKETFAESGGGELRYIPALNANDLHVAALAKVVERTASDWI